jgi:hypothetical protein
LSSPDAIAYRVRNDLLRPNAATGGNGGDGLFMTAYEQRLGGKMLLTGHYGDGACERANGKGGVDMVDSAGADLIYFRTRVGLLHFRVPSIGYSEFTSTQRIANSQEMRPWQLRRNHYDRPIPRRIVEEAGVPSELFGQRKKIAARVLRFCNPAGVREPDLQKVMAPKSYRHFSQWTSQVKLYSSEFDRWTFTVVHKLYRINARIIRSRKIRTIAQCLRIAVPTRSWIPIRFSDHARPLDRGLEV